MSQIASLFSTEEITPFDSREERTDTRSVKVLIVWEEDLEAVQRELWGENISQVSQKSIVSILIGI